eukprot:TRINITY_DN4269_c0_g1_i1.p1 TRINITY_DN4269_c0_g1~~TRINITY_DN4269_c0_g1_i1.p1  ORF type:complete len:137 (+),score=39.58 TRINITY_DN4269_c0_g1_i1:139-549(+)
MAEDGESKQEHLTVVKKKDVTPRYTGDACIHWVIGKDSGGARELTMGCTTIKPGGKNPLHIHPNCEEILHLLEGEVEHIVEGDDGELHHFRMEDGDSIVVPRGKKHQAINVGLKDARWIVTFSSADRQTIICDSNK